MTAQHVRVLTDGEYFLARAGELLSQIQLAVICQVCAAHGVYPAVDATVHLSQVDWRCGHRAGWIKRGTRIDLTQLLQTLHWTIACARCQEPATADNDKKDASFQVRCGCTTREMANPLAPVASESPRPDTVGELGRAESR